MLIDLVRKVVESNGEKSILLYGDGSQVRHFTVYDFASAVRSISLQLTTLIMFVVVTK